jgi:hypothetical protein
LAITSISSFRSIRPIQSTQGFDAGATLQPLRDPVPGSSHYTLLTLRITNAGSNHRVNDPKLSAGPRILASPPPHFAFVEQVISLRLPSLGPDLLIFGGALSPFLASLQLLEIPLGGSIAPNLQADGPASQPSLATKFWGAACRDDRPIAVLSDGGHVADGVRVKACSHQIATAIAEGWRLDARIGVEAEPVATEFVGIVAPP